MDSDDIRGLIENAADRYDDADDILAALGLVDPDADPLTVVLAAVLALTDRVAAQTAEAWGLARNWPGVSTARLGGAENESDLAV